MSERKVTAFGRSAMPVISSEHNHIHGGEMWTAGVSNGALGAAAYLYIQFNVPAGLEVHIKAIEFYNSLAATFTLLEAPTVTNGSTGIVPMNRKRASLRSYGSILFSDPTAITPTLTLDTMNFTGSLLNNIGPQNNDFEWVFKASTKYVLRLQNNGGVAATSFMKVHFYEESL